MLRIDGETTYAPNHRRRYIPIYLGNWAEHELSVHPERVPSGYIGRKDSGRILDGQSSEGSKRKAEGLLKS